MSKHCFLRRHPGEGTPMILAIVLVLLMLFCTVAEFSRVWIIAQGVKEAAQQAVISTINDNYDDVYHAVREGYAAGWYPDGTGRWDESVDTGDVYGQLASTLGLENTGSGYQKISNGNVEYTISGLSVELSNNALSSGQSKGYTAAVEIRLEVPVRFLGNLFSHFFFPLCSCCVRLFQLMPPVTATSTAVAAAWAAAHPPTTGIRVWTVSAFPW